MKRILILLLLITTINFAQELNAKVTMNIEKLETLGRENLVDFDKHVEEYLNNNSFAGDGWEGEKIDCNFVILFNSADENDYSASVIITSNRPIYNTNQNTLMLKIQDPNWNFRYERNQNFYYSPTEFDALLSFLDYYAYLIIGIDMDSYLPEGGTEFYTRASDLAVLGSNSAYSTGWKFQTSTYNKRGLIDDLLRANFQQFRVDFYDYHYNGLDILAENKEEGLKNMAKLFFNLEGIYDKISRMNVLMRVFFDTKHKEIYNYLKDYHNSEVLTVLKKIDPSHISTYDAGFNN